MTKGEQLAGAYHEWFASGEGQGVADVATLGADIRHAPYLSNRLWHAFMAGAEAAEKISEARIAAALIALESHGSLREAVAVLRGEA